MAHSFVVSQSPSDSNISNLAANSQLIDHDVDGNTDDDIGVIMKVEEALDEGSYDNGLDSDAIENEEDDLMLNPIIVPSQHCLNESDVNSNEQLQQDEAETDGNVISEFMDINEPLTTLRTLIENRLQCSLQDYEFWLQDQVQLTPDQSLAVQCVEQSGVVQIQVELQSENAKGPRLNIVDVLKPSDSDDDEAHNVAASNDPVTVPIMMPSVDQLSSSELTTTTRVYQLAEQKTQKITRWIVDMEFRKDQERRGIPFDPLQWTSGHVKHWIRWAVDKFNLSGVNVNKFSNMTGGQLMSLQHKDFKFYVPNDVDNILWTHLELLRKCKFAAIIQRTLPVTSQLAMVTKFPRKNLTSTIPASIPQYTIHGNQSGISTNSGQIQLWQFLLDLLTDHNYLNVIQWIGNEGEFKLVNPELVAQLWGSRKGKMTMNYEKLSRALRYYYEGDMIAKVHGKRYVYKFVCDLRTLLGYSAAELSQLVLESVDRPSLGVS